MRRLYRTDGKVRLLNLMKELISHQDMNAPFDQITAALSRVIVSDEELRHYGDISDTAGKARALLAQQKDTWELARKGYASLDAMTVRVFRFDGFEVHVNYTPQRITSSAAKVDPKSIKERKCFLCIPHLPPGQRGFLVEEQFVVLCNPFPIFAEHFTIPALEHQPQQIVSTFPVLLNLSRDMQRFYTVFYNGPKCGASAPDHLHFQAGGRGVMPIEAEYDRVVAKHGRVLVDEPGMRAVAVAEGYLRRFLAYETADAAAAQRMFDVCVRTLQAVSGVQEEPMMNILASCDRNGWRILIFPRTKHRPSFFFAEEEKKILLSPAAVDMGGILTTPVEKDFHRMTEEVVVAMFEEVTVAKEVMEEVGARVKQGWKKR